MNVPEEIRNLFDKRVIICVGPGGVGKTTVSALLGLIGATLGRRIICVTVDPSERLAESLGLRDGRSAESLNEDASFDTGGMEEKIHAAAEGLDAMVIHGPWVIDRAMSKYIPEDKWETVKNGKIYPYMRNTLRGLHELASMVLIDDLAAAGRWSTIIVDTAPSAHAVDFLEMPERISDATRSPALSILRGTASIAGKKYIGKVSSVILKSIGKLVGLDFLHELTEFLRLNEESLENIRRAAETMRRNLLDGAACIVQVTSPSAQSVDESLALYKTIMKEGLSTHAFVINRALPFARGDGPAEPPEAARAKDNGLEEKLRRNYREMEKLVRSQEKETARIVKRASHGAFCIKIPMLDEDVCSIPILKRLVGEVEVLEKTTPDHPH